MKHYPPIFIIVMYALLGGIYGLTLGYIGYKNAISIPWCILMASIFSFVIMSIFVYTPSIYDTKITEAEEQLQNNMNDVTELEKLRSELVNTFSSKNKYYIQWFIVLLYVPICIHYMYRCVLNPISYTYLMDYLYKLFHVKYDDLPSFVEQSDNLLDTLQNLDKHITYSSTEKDLMTKIKESIQQNKKIKLEDEDYVTLRKLRKKLENNDYFYNNQSLQGVYNLLTSLFKSSKTNVQDNGLYVFNLIVMGIVMSYVFVYGHTTKLLIIPLFTIFLSLSIFYLKG